MDANKIIQHLLDISKGECSITEESILKLTDKDDQTIELGLLTLFEEVEYNKKKLEDSNREKEILLKEIHHRVKNNLQIISSLLTLQNSFINDETAKSLLDDCRSRVNTMAIIHEKLYRSKDFSNVDYKDYLEELVVQLKSTHSFSPDKLQIELDVPSLKLDLDIAIPLGLLINEILTNSFKYGSGDESGNKIYLKIREKGPNSFDIVLGDNGPGYPDNIFHSDDNTLGVQLIRQLATQLDGTVNKVNMPDRKGTHYQVLFSANSN